MASGNASNVFAVGDLFPIQMNGTVEICNVTGNWYGCVIGIDHNKELEGDKTIHIHIPYDETGKGLAFVDGNYGNGFSTNGFLINPNNSSKYATTSSQYKYGFTEGGWASSYANKTLMPQFLSVMPITWRDIINAAPKWRDNVGGTTTADSQVTQSSSPMWYLAEWEVFGVRRGANEAEQNYQKHYDYYKNAGSKVRYKYYATTIAAIWWLASVHATDTYIVRGVNTSGGNEDYGAATSWGAAPAFAIAA